MSGHVPEVSPADGNSNPASGQSEHLESNVGMPPGSFDTVGECIGSDDMPSLERFYTRYMSCSPEGRPVVLAGVRLQL